MVKLNDRQPYPTMPHYETKLVARTKYANMFQRGPHYYWVHLGRTGQLQSSQHFSSFAGALVAYIRGDLGFSYTQGWCSVCGSRF